MRELMKTLDFETCYAAIERRDTSVEGCWFFAVKTTGIFCRPTCRARMPLRKNVEFFATTKDALCNGYRPCKRCKPLQLPDQTPDEIMALLDEIGAKPDQPINDQNLRERGLQPEKIRRWFNKHHHMTFQAYQRLVRLNRAYSGLANGDSVISSAFEAGYESLSGFNTRFKDILGTPPSAIRQGNETFVRIEFERFSTPLGPMMAGASDEGLCFLEFTDRRGLEKELIDLKKRIKGVILPGNSKVIEQTKQQLADYFSGTLQDFSLPLFTPGTPFQQQVWDQLRTIPYGQTRSYKEQAGHIGNPKAVRAVATANGMNRLAIIIPCHRVIGSDGSLTGYAGGLARKQWLLDHEANG